MQSPPPPPKKKRKKYDFMLLTIMFDCLFICIGNNKPKQDKRNKEPRERFRYVYPDRIELSFNEQINQGAWKEGTYLH